MELELIAVIFDFHWSIYNLSFQAEIRDTLHHSNTNPHEYALT